MEETTGGGESQGEEVRRGDGDGLERGAVVTGACCISRHRVGLFVLMPVSKDTDIVMLHVNVDELFLPETRVRLGPGDDSGVGDQEGHRQTYGQ